MNHNVVLKGKKVILRPLSLKDAPRFCNWLADPEVTKFLLVHEIPKPTLKQERDWINKEKAKKDAIHLSLDTASGQHIGSIGLVKINRYHKNAQFGIMIGNKKYWGQGYGTEATKLMISYGFKKLKLHKVYLDYIAYNIRGEKAYQKAGFKQEGVLRETIYRHGHWHNQIIMGILREEYLKKKGK